MAPQIYEKSMLRRGSVWGAFSGGPMALKVLTISTFWTHFGNHFRQNIEQIYQKRHPKINAGEVSTKNDKMLKNNAKMNAEIQRVSYFFEKGENARNYCIYNRKRGSGHLEMHEHLNKI